jgi:two-component system, NtrC family, sensor histidine kinase KinB
MTFKSKLMLTMAPLVVALALVGLVSGIVAGVLARQPGTIWKDNYRSMLSAQRMKESIERLYDFALWHLLGSSVDQNLREQYLVEFEREFDTEVHNITEKGETDAVERLRRQWADYQAALTQFHAEPDPRRQREVAFPALTRTFEAVKRGADEILEINQDAMVLKGRRTEERAARFERLLTVAVVLASVIGLLISVSLTTRLLRPLGVVSAAVRRFGQGDLQVRARVQGDDDIAKLAQEFNTMADRLERYRRSSLGELLQAQQATQAAIDSLPDPVLMLDASGSLEGRNEAARTVLGIDPDERGSSSLDRVDPTVRALIDRLRAHVVGGRGAYHPRGFEDALRITSAAGEGIYLPRATPIYGEGGAVTGSSLVFQDITRLFRFDELKNNLVATVAHEFRTPLTSLRMAIHLCTEEAVGPLTPKQADLLFAAREDCERLQTIVDDLLNLSRLESGRIDLQKRRVEPRSLVGLSVDLHRGVAGSQGVSLRGEVYPGLPELFADPDRLQLVFANLLTNAIRYSHKDDEVVVRALPVQAQSGDTAGAVREVVRFEVVDHGPGIPAEHQPALFDKFFRVPGSPTGGAGLGLFIARGIVQAHDGAMGVASQPGQGSTFWFTIPAAREGIA